MPHTQGGLIRVKVFGHNGRAVGYSDNEVWIDWQPLGSGFANIMVACERP